jgi:5'-methylthioadenosine phosphorylase
MGGMAADMIGIIGGTGLYRIDGLEIEARRAIDTPYGKPSAPIAVGRLEGKPVAFLPRHGENHELLPSEINFRANIWALKAAGARRLVAASAVGSLQEEIEPGHLALVSQYIDWTRGRREGTFFGDGIAAHISSAEPACPALRARLAEAGKASGARVHDGKTYACVEGPRLGTRAESFLLRQAGAHVVGMTNLPEAFLAREAQLCYCTVAIATDYDCWLDDPSRHVTVDQVIEQYGKSLGQVRGLLLAFARGEAGAGCGCRTALRGAVLTRPESLTADRRRRLDFLME